MINRLLQDLQERNAMEVLPEVDQMIETLENLKNNKLFELKDFASRYGMVMAQPNTQTEVNTVVETRVEKVVETVVDTAKSEELGKQIIEDAKLQAESILAKAKDEANALILSTRDDLEIKVTAMLEEAEMEAEDIRSGAKIEANFIKERAINEANEEADRIIIEANNKVSNIINEALADAEKLVKDIKEEIVEDTTDSLDISDAIADSIKEVEKPEIVVEVANDTVENTSAIIKTMDEDKRHKNAHVGTATIGDRHVIFHSARYMDMPVVYDACEGDEELVKQAILAQDPKYFDNASKVYRYVDYTNKTSMYLNADGVYVGYVDGYAVSWAKDFTVPSYLRYKYVNVKGFKPANKPEFISKVSSLIAKHNAGLEVYNEELEATRAHNRSANYIVFSDDNTVNDNIIDPDITIVQDDSIESCFEGLSAFEAFCDME